MKLFGVRYWMVLFWLNVVTAVIHALHGNRLMFLSMGMAVLCRVFLQIVKQKTENENV